MEGARKVKTIGSTDRSITLHASITDVIKDYNDGKLDNIVAFKSNIELKSFTVFTNNFKDKSLVFTFNDKINIKITKVYTNIGTRTNMTCDWCRVDLSGEEVEKFGIPVERTYEIIKGGDDSERKARIEAKYFCHGLFCGERCALRGYYCYHKEDPVFSKSEELLREIYDTRFPGLYLREAQDFYLLEINGGNLTHKEFNGNREYKSQHQIRMSGVGVSYLSH